MMIDPVVTNGLLNYLIILYLVVIADDIRLDLLICNQFLKDFKDFGLREGGAGGDGASWPCIGILPLMRWKKTKREF